MTAESPEIAIAYLLIGAAVFLLVERWRRRTTGEEGRANHAEWVGAAWPLAFAWPLVVLAAFAFGVLSLMVAIEEKAQD